MNKAFEKIFERLSNIYRVVKTDEDAEWNRAIYKSTKIVKEVAEEYKDGWIPCSERLPEEYTVLCCDNYGEMIVGHPYFDEVSNTNYSVESDNEMMYDCVAWQPLPEPFKERDSD